MAAAALKQGRRAASSGGTRSPLRVANIDIERRERSIHLDQQKSAPLINQHAVMSKARQRLAPQQSVGSTLI
jgi:hypothetical protein